MVLEQSLTVTLDGSTPTGAVEKGVPVARRRLLVLAVAPLLALTGCEWTTDTGAAGTDPLAAAVEATLAAGTARTAVTLETGAAGHRLAVTGDGVVDFARGASRHVFTFPADLVAGPVEQLSVDGALWLRTPDTGGRYVDVAGPVGTHVLGLVPGGDPLGQLAALGEAETVRETGREDVSGVATTRYEAVVPVDAAAGHLGGGLAAAGLDQVSVVAHVDDDGRVRRLAPRLEGAGRDGEGAALQAVVEFTDFGLAVDVQPPTPSEVDEEFLDDIYGEALDALGDEPGEGLAPPALDDVLAGLSALREELRS